MELGELWCWLIGVPDGAFSPNGNVLRISVVEKLRGAWIGTSLVLLDWVLVLQGYMYICIVSVHSMVLEVEVFHKSRARCRNSGRMAVDLLKQADRRRHVNQSSCTSNWVARSALLRCHVQGA